jgi:DNA polymerase III delta prime subunit
MFLLKAAEQERMNHAYLLDGNATAQKLEVTRLLLRRLFPAGKELYDSEKHPDVLWMRQPLSIAQVQEIRRFISLTSSQGMRRVVVVEQAQDMNEEAQAAFLNILEEPSASALFLLLAHPAALLSLPFRSRLQAIPFFTFLRESKLAGANDLSQIKKMSLHKRFAHAKQMAEDSAACVSSLESWMEQLHALFLKRTKESDAADSLKKLLEIMQDVWFALRTTNVNTRLAMEEVFLAL